MISRHFNQNDPKIYRKNEKKKKPEHYSRTCSNTPFFLRKALRYDFKIRDRSSAKSIPEVCFLFA